MDVEVITTGWPTLDEAIGLGGIPVCRITEISGPSRAEKNALALSMIESAQRLAERVAYVGRDPLDWCFAADFAAREGLWRLQQPTDHEVLHVAETLVGSADWRLVVVGPFGGEGELSFRVGGQLRSILRTATQANTALVFITGEESTAYSIAVRYYASVRLDVRRSSEGNRLARVKVVKNTLAPPFGEVELNL